MTERFGSKNGKAAAGENAPAAVPPATLPVLEPLCESVENTQRGKLASFGRLVLDLRPALGQLCALLDGQAEQVDEACCIGLVVILVHAEGSGLLIVQGVRRGDACVKNCISIKKKKCNRLEDMNKSYFCSERVRLRAMEPEDLEVMYAMENDSQTWDVTNFTVPYSRFVLKQYIENSECDMFADRQLRMMIVRAEDDVVIGTIDITEFSPMHARGEVGIAIRKEYQGNGYAKEALRLLCDYVFSFLYLKQLIVHISVDNEASIRLFESCGFVRCGLLKEWWRVGGCYKDVVLLQLLRSTN